MDITTFVHTQRQEARLNGDSNAYRSMCSRRIATLRKRLGRSNPKRYAAQVPLTAEDLAKNPRSIPPRVYVIGKADAHAAMPTCCF